MFNQRKPPRLRNRAAFLYGPHTCGTGAGFTPFTAPAGLRGNDYDYRSDREDSGWQAYAYRSPHNRSVRAGRAQKRPSDGQGFTRSLGEAQWLGLGETLGNGGCLGRTASGVIRKGKRVAGSADSRSTTASNQAQRLIAGNLITASLSHIIQNLPSFPKT